MKHNNQEVTEITAQPSKDSIPGVLENDQLAIKTYDLKNDLAKQHIKAAADCGWLIVDGHQLPVFI